MRTCTTLILFLLLNVGMMPALIAVEVFVPDRVFCDVETGTTFRLPYCLLIRGPQSREFYCLPSFAPTRSLQTERLMRVRYLKVEGGADQLQANAAKILQQEGVSQEIPLSDYDYYAPAGVAYRQPEWAPAGIVAVQANSASHMLLLCATQYSSSGLLIDGKIDLNIATAIINSFEIMATIEGQKWTWRAYQSAQGNICNRKGEALDAAKTKTAASWDEAYEVESEHFHISFTCPGKLVATYLELLESLYLTLKQWFPIEVDPYLKYEIHITKTAEQFGNLAADILHNNSYRSVANEGAAFGGFFASSAQATFTYTDKVKNSPMNAQLQLTHEVVHQYWFVNSNQNYTLPLWFNEAIAVMFETGRFTSKAQQMIAPVARFDALRLYYKDKPAINSVKDYVNGNFGFTNVHQYAEAYAIVHYLWEEKGGPERFLEYWKRLRAGEDGRQLFKDVFLTYRLENVAHPEEFYQTWQKDMLVYIQKKKADKAPRFR